MCLSLPATARKAARPSRLPAPLAVALGGAFLLGLLACGLLAERLRPASRPRLPVR